MSQLPSVDQSPPASTPAATPNFEAEAHAFWLKNRNVILLGCVAVLLVIAGREGYRYFTAMREQSIQDDYAAVADKPDKLPGFADAHPDHVLAGVAYLQLADQKFTAGDYRSAGSLYTKAAGILKNNELSGRARLGAAVSLISGGDQAAGEAALKALSADTTIFKDIRAEATYHLASLALEAGRIDDLKKLVEDITKIDLAGSWTQRATLLLVAPGSTPAATDSSVLNFKPAGQ